MKTVRDRYATLSLPSTIVTGAFTSLHHAYEIGFYAVILVAIFMVSPALVMQWYRKTRSRASLLVYGLLNTWLVFGFGVVDGFWNHIILPLGLRFRTLASLHGGGSTIVESIAVGNWLYEGAGILTFGASIFAAYYAYKFIRVSTQSGNTVTTRINVEKG